MMSRYVVWPLLLLMVMAIATARPGSACVLEDFQVSSAPQLPNAGAEFELTINYQGSYACISAENFSVNGETLLFEISCDCPFVTTIPVPQQFQTTIPGLPAGIYTFEAIHVDSTPAPRTVASDQILVGQAPSIPLSGPALILFTLTLAGAAFWMLRR